MSQLTTEDLRPDCCIEYYVVCGGFTEPHGAITRRDRTGVLPPPDSLDANWFPTPAWCNLCCWYADPAGDQPLTTSPNQTIYYLYFLNESGNQVSFGGVEWMWGVCDSLGNWAFYKPGSLQDGCIVIGNLSYSFQMSVNGGYDFWGNSGDSYGALTFNALSAFGNWWNYWAACDFWYWGEFCSLHSWRLTDYQCDTDGFRATWRIPSGFPVFGELAEDGQRYIGAGVRYFRVEAAAPTLATKCHTITIHGCGNNVPLPGAVYDIYNQHWNGSSYDYTLRAEGTTDYSGIVQWDNSVGLGWNPVGVGGPLPDRLYRTINIPVGTIGHGRFKPQIVSAAPQFPYTGYYQPVIEFLNQPATGFVCSSNSYFQPLPYPLAQYMNWTIIDVRTQAVLWSSDTLGPLYSAGGGWLLEFDYLFEGCAAAGCPDPQLIHVIMTMIPGQPPYGQFYIQFYGVSYTNFCPDSGTGYTYLTFSAAVSCSTGLPFLLQALTDDYTGSGIAMFCSTGPLLFTATEAI